MLQEQVTLSGSVQEPGRDEELHFSSDVPVTLQGQRGTLGPVLSNPVAGKEISKLV